MSCYIHSALKYDCLKKGLENAGLQNSYPAETVAVVSLLHGICKVNFYKKGFRNVKDEETGQWYKKEVYVRPLEAFITANRLGDKSAVEHNAPVVDLLVEGIIAPLGLGDRKLGELLLDTPMTLLSIKQSKRRKVQFQKQRQNRRN